MPRRASLTILLITDRKAMRADFTSGASPRLIDVWQVEQSVTGGAAGGLPGAVELAATLGPRLASRVYVLATEAWTQTLAVPADSVRGLPEDELAQALAFEVESFSGIEAFQSRLAHREVGATGQHRTFWITQIDAGHLDLIEELLAARGGKLAGIGSPVGLPGPVGGAQGNRASHEERRLEFWPGAVGFVAPSAPPFIANADPRTDRWRRVLEQWETEHGPAEPNVHLLAPDAPTAAPTPSGNDSGDGLGQPICLDDPDALRQWLKGWARELNGRTLHAPMLVPPRRPMSRQRRSAIMGVITALAVTVCAVHWSCLAAATRNAEREVQQLENIAKRVKQSEERKAEVDKNIQQLENQLATVEQQWGALQRSFRSYCHRFGSLLALLSNLHDEKVVVTDLVTEAQGVSVRGMSLSPDAATEMAMQMRKRLLCCGWKVEMPQQEARKQLAGGGPWQFTILLRDIPPVEAQPAGENVAAAVRPND